MFTKFFRVESDGTPDNTKIYYGDEEVQGVTNLNIAIDAENPVVMATFTVLNPLLNIKLPAECTVIEQEHIPENVKFWEPIKPNYDSIFRKEPINQDSSA